MHVRSWLSPYVRVRSIISLRIRCGGWGWGLVAARSCALHLNLRRRWSPHSSLLPSPVAGRAWSFPPVAFVAHLVFSTFEIQLNGSGDGQRIVAIENPCCGWGPGPGILVSCLSLSLSLSLSLCVHIMRLGNLQSSPLLLFLHGVSFASGDFQYERAFCAAKGKERRRRRRKE